MPDALISYPFTEEGLRSALKALGTTADAVARNLQAMGFKGCVTDSSNCPVANYLLAAITGAISVAVEFGVASVWDGDGTQLAVDWPDPVDEFIEYFDNGYLPQLEVTDASS